MRIMAETEPDSCPVPGKRETLAEETLSTKIEDFVEDDQDFENNMYLLGVLDQDLVNGWEAWMAVLTPKEYLADFSDLSFEELMDRCIKNWEGDNLPPVRFPPMDGNGISKPLTRSRKKCLLISKKQWKSLAHFMNTFQSHLFGGAESWLKKLFHNQNSKNQGSSSTQASSLFNDYGQSDVSSTIFKKWISVRESSEQNENKQNKCFGGPKSGGFSTVGKMRIEIRTDDNSLPTMGEDEECLRLHQNQWIRIKVTMFSSSLDFYQMEIDLVQSFVCATKTDRCRRRIAKVVKREVISKIDWEKGVNAAGSYFAVHWNRFQIPELSSIEQDKHDKFELCNFEYELRLRFFSDDEFGQTVASACSFPLIIMTEAEDFDGDSRL